MVSEEKIFENGGRTDAGQTTEGRRLDGYTISSPCEPNGSSELKMILLWQNFTATKLKRGPGLNCCSQKFDPRCQHVAG